MGRIVAIGGGETETTRPIDRFLVELTGKDRASFLFVGTASHDDAGYISEIRREFESLGCAVEALCLTMRTYTDEEIDRLLDQADLIYVGGGDTAFMIETWKRYGLDQKLKEIYRTDRAVLSGLSAGAMCWFHCGHSDSRVFWKDDQTVGYGWVDGLLDIHPFAFCPHYNMRTDSFDEMLREKHLPGLAVEENAAFVEDNGHISYIASVPSAKAYVLEYTDGKLEKREQEVTVLS